VRNDPPFRPDEVETLSAATSSATGRRYGLERVCRAGGLARSTCYARRARAASPRAPAPRGPRPAVADELLLAAIRADLAESPFRGEGHRKVWARLRVQRKIRVGKDRVLHLMREYHLLSPHRARQGQEQLHEGTIVTTAPNVMWGTDGLRVFTLEDGWGWVLAAVEHWNAECMGWHVVKLGDRFAALEPVAQGVRAEFGAVGADAARGLKLRIDHGTPYLADHFQNQIKYWGIAPSFAFLEQPQTNGVVERFFRTLREQVLHGRTYRTLAEVREAVGAFIELYNESWLLEKLGYQSPRQARREHEAHSTRKVA
jgi:transposase InsO family protein